MLQFVLKVMVMFVIILTIQPQTTATDLTHRVACILGVVIFISLLTTTDLTHRVARILGVMIFISLLTTPPTTTDLRD